MSEALARDIAVLAELFNEGGWRELRVEAEGVKLLFSTDPQTAGLDEHTSTVRPEPAEGPSFLTEEGRASTSSARTGEGNGTGDVDPSWIPVTAPNLGTFYRSPKPGAEPFVKLGQSVAVDTEICLLEVMKLFTSVQAGAAGVVRRICAEDAELVRGGQLLFYIEPE